jgi:hypothetical protein
MLTQTKSILGRFGRKQITNSWSNKMIKTSWEILFNQKQLENFRIRKHIKLVRFNIFEYWKSPNVIKLTWIYESKFNHSKEMYVSSSIAYCYNLVSVFCCFLSEIDHNKNFGLSNRWIPCFDSFSILKDLENI